MVQYMFDQNWTQFIRTIHDWVVVRQNIRYDSEVRKLNELVFYRKQIDLAPTELTHPIKRSA